MSYSVELTNMKVSKGEELWEVSERKIKVVMKQKLRLSFFSVL